MHKKIIIKFHNFRINCVCISWTNKRINIINIHGAVMKIVNTVSCIIKVLFVFI